MRVTLLGNKYAFMTIEGGKIERLGWRYKEGNIHKPTKEEIKVVVKKLRYYTRNMIALRTWLEETSKKGRGKK